MVDRQRNEIASLLERLSEDEARARLVPSLTTPLGLVKHSTFVERVWFHHRVAGVPRAELGLPDEVDDSFQLAEKDTVETVRAAYVDACAGADVNCGPNWRNYQAHGDFSVVWPPGYTPRTPQSGDVTSPVNGPFRENASGICVA